MHDTADLELLIRARTPLIHIASADTETVEALCKPLARSTQRKLYRWTLVHGLVPLGATSAGARRSLASPVDALNHILTLQPAGLYLMLDLHRHLDDPMVLSLLRELLKRQEKHPQTLLLVTPELEIPAELKLATARFELALPSDEALAQMIRDEARQWSQQNSRPVRTDRKVLAALSRNLQGVSMAEARRLVRNAIYDDGVLCVEDLPRVQQARYELLDQGGVLSFELGTLKMDQVAGLGRLKKWLKLRREVFLADEPPPGLDMPKGLLLLGVQGGGKSLAAKAVAGAWQLPLLRLDFGSLYNKYHGETERNLRESLNTAGIMAPCVLWIDEIEKGLGSSDNDEGISRRVLGTLLTWMAERKNRVFLVATANDISSLPPELLRKGRFDEIFFVDLPTAEVREAIFRIHLSKRDQDPGTIDTQQLAQACEGFTGAEIEQAVVSALYAAHASRGALSTELILEEIRSTRPLSVLMAEEMHELRSWAAERTVPAS